jgi:hypothetical protein
VINVVMTILDHESQGYNVSYTEGNDPTRFSLSKWTSFHAQLSIHYKHLSRKKLLRGNVSRGG